MKKKIVTTLLVGLMLVTLTCPMVLAANNQTAVSCAEDGFDTLSFTQAEYNVSAGLARQSDESYLEALVIGFLASTKASIREPSLYDNQSGFVAATASTNSTVQYRLTEAEYTAALYDEMGWEITSDNISFDQFDAEIDDTTATVSIVEDYTYSITDGFDSDSFRRREYTFEVEKVNGTWQIVSVTTNDPWELESDFEYAAIDVDTAIQSLREDNAAILNNSATLAEVISEEEIEPAATTLNRWTYSVEDAVAYAVAHYADTSNSVFGFTTGNDCQNFASQCVWAGLGGSGTSTSARPAVSTAVAGSSAANVWQRNVATTCYSSDTYWLNWTWDNARGFAYMMTQSSFSAEGPYGNTQYSGYFAYTAAGNILTVDWAGAPARDTLDHAMFVTEVSGTSGSRTTSQVKVAAHTSATNSAYETVSAYTGMAASAFARVVVNYGHYSTTQP